MSLRQILSLAWRESRFARGKLFLFLSSITLGVAALVAVQGFGSNMQREVRNQARAMLGADVSLSTRQPFADEVEALLDSIGDTGVPVARVTSFASMAFHAGTGNARLVQVRAPDADYPFYGTIETEPADQWRTLSEGRNVIADPALLLALDASVGDSIAIGALTFRIVASLQKLPGDVEIASSFAPRVFMPMASLGDTELLGYGARIDYEAFLKIPDPDVASSFVETNREVFRAARVRARTLEDQQERMEDALGRLSDFLGLIGVFALLLGGIGVASAMNAYMARKADSVAVLRCLGATSGQLLGLYLLQAVAMGVVGSVVGVLIGAGAQLVLPRLFEGLLPVDVIIRPAASAVVLGLVVGISAAAVFTLMPLLRIRTVSPLRALRRGVEPLSATGPDYLRMGAWVALAGSVLLLVIYQAGQVLVGAVIALGIGATLAVLWVMAAAVTRLMRRLPKAGLPYTVRQGVANLHRPENQTTIVLLALGFGVFLISTLILTRDTILRPLQVDASRGNFLLFDVQSDQIPTVEEVLAARDVQVVQSAPIVPMRIAAINGVDIAPVAPSSDEALGADGGMDEFDEAREDPSGWATRREYRSTYRDTLTAGETLVSGTWWDADDSPAASPAGGGPFEVSLDQDVASELRVGLGDTITWDVQGVRVPTIITSLRSIDWARLEPNFFAVFEPAALRAAPQMWVLLARADSAETRGLLQRDLVMRYPNVSTIDLTLIQRALDEVIGRVSMVVRFLAGFSVATGFVVLLGAVATGRPQRIRESVLLKTLGATRPQIGRILVTEYALLGVLSALVGIALALLAGWGIARGILEVPLVVSPAPLLMLAAFVALLSAAIGLSASRDVFRTTPMEAIREG